MHDASELYEVARWGNGYFSVNAAGHVQVHPTKDPARAIDLKELIDRLQLRGISLPVLVRFTDILKHRLGDIHAAFQGAIASTSTRAATAASIRSRSISSGRSSRKCSTSAGRTSSASRPGSKPELLAVVALADNDTPIICNGFKDKDVELAGRPLLRAAHAHVARPDRQPELDQLLEVAHGGVDQDRGRAVDLGLGGQQVADEGHGRGLGHRQHEHLAGLQRGHRRVDHEVVVLRAARDARGPGDPRARHHLMQGRVDEAAAPAALVDRRRAQPRQLGVVALAHSSLTTWGITR